LITLAKTDTEARRRLAFSRLRDAEVVTKLFADLGLRFRARAGGYTRILHMLPRPGDAAPMALMQLVERTPAAQVVQPPVAMGAPTPAARGKRASKKAAAPEGNAAAPAKRAPRKKKAAAA
jgi:hypothetical protein